MFSHHCLITSGSRTRRLKNMTSGSGRFLKKPSRAFSSPASSGRICTSMPSSVVKVGSISLSASSNDILKFWLGARDAVYSVSVSEAAGNSSPVMPALLANTSGLSAAGFKLQRAAKWEMLAVFRFRWLTCWKSSSLSRRGASASGLRVNSLLRRSWPPPAMNCINSGNTLRLNPSMNRRWRGFKRLNKTFRALLTSN